MNKSNVLFHLEEDILQFTLLVWSDILKKKKKEREREGRKPMYIKGEEETKKTSSINVQIDKLYVCA